jgi:hypothetical protein
MTIYIGDREIIVGSWADKEILYLYERMKSLHPEESLEDFIIRLFLQVIDSARQVTK